MTRIDLDGKVTGVFADYHYVGTGDIGGAADEETVKLLEAIGDQGRSCASAPGHTFGGPLAGPAPARNAGDEWAKGRCM